MDASLKKAWAANGAKGVAQGQYLLTWALNILFGNLSILLFVLLWELACRFDFVPQTFIAPPSAVLGTLWDMLTAGTLFKHIRVSFFRSFYGFVLAAVVALPLGFLLGGWFRLFERIMTPVLRLLAEINPFSLFPVFIVFFGIGETSKTMMIFWVCLWPILLNTITGIQNVDGLLVKSARSMGVDGRDLFLKVILPAASPNVFHGLRTGAGVAFFMLIAAEMMGASSGLGWLVFYSQINYQIPKLFATTVTIAALGLSLNFLFGVLENRWLSWKEKPPQY
ncbi:MAG TPA: ABC transporter permease [Negativicutes bacterium]|nr:ABC transporter permease [Negativicutes bacterium]